MSMRNVRFGSIHHTLVCVLLVFHPTLIKRVLDKYISYSFRFIILIFLADVGGLKTDVIHIHDSYVINDNNWLQMSNLDSVT